MKNEENNNQANQNSQNSANKNKGFASMDKEKAREIQSEGGKTVSEDRKHMSEIGKKGAESKNQEEE